MARQPRLRSGTVAMRQSATTDGVGRET
jgi:hypothetical protein